MSEDIHKWTRGRYVLMFDEHTFFVQDNENDERMIALEVTKRLNEQQATINELQSIINHIKCEENCEDYDYCCETVCSLYKEIKHLKEENDRIKTKGLDVLAFYESKLKNVLGTEDFQSVRDEIWIVRQVLYEMGVINDE